MDDPIQAFLQSIGAGTPGNGMPGGGVLGARASSPGGPGLPILPDQITPPKYSTIPPFKSLAPYTGGASTENIYSSPRIAPSPTSYGEFTPGEGSPTSYGEFTPGSSTSYGEFTPGEGSPASWFKADPNATFEAGQPMGQAAEGGWPPGLSTKTVIDIARNGGGSPLMKALIAAGYMMRPTSTAANDTISPEMARQLPQHPQSHGMMPPVQGPLATPPPQGGPYVGSGPPPTSPRSPPPAPQTAGPVMPPPRPATSPVPGKKQIDPAAVDLGKVPRFTTVQYQVPNGNRYQPNGGRSRAPIYTALDLSRLFGGARAQ